MALVTLQIHGKPFDLTCDDGQEPHLEMLAEELSERLASFDARLSDRRRNPVPEATIWTLTAITLLDELNDARTELDRLRRQGVNTSQSFESGKRIEMEQAMSETLDSIADRVERISHSL